MENTTLEQLNERKEELEATLNKLEELMESRNNVLYCFEKNVFDKTTNRMFSNLNTGSNGNMLSGINLIKKNYELDLRLYRRVLFYLHKRKRNLQEEHREVEENIKQFQVESTDLSQSA
jgi:prefoldin subunit 5